MNWLQNYLNKCIFSLSYVMSLWQYGSNCVFIYYVMKKQEKIHGANQQHIQQIIKYINIQILIFSFHALTLKFKLKLICINYT